MSDPNPALRGMLSTDQLAELRDRGDLDTVLVAFPDLYGRLVGKRYDVDFFLEQVVSGGSHACDYLFSVDMEMEPVPGYSFANWEKGYGDVHVVPDMETLRVASWLDRTALVLCDVYGAEQHAPLPLAPRSLLREVRDRARASGFEALAATELEFFCFEDSYRAAHDQDYAGLDPTGWYIEDYHVLQTSREEPLVGAIRRHLRDSGVPVENSKGEWGLGQHEINVRYTDVLAMADRHSVYKQLTKEVADQLGCSVTFMAKPYAERAGSSCHIHLSLSRDGENAMPGSEDLGGVRCSEVFRHFLGGWIAHVPDVMVFYAPTVNSYKRFQAGSWAPTRLAWSYDNRTAGFRVVGGGASLRIECRIPGADCNPYLALAASLASGLDGVVRRLEPPPLFSGDVYAADELPHVPRSLSEACERFATSSFAAEAFGPEVVEHYAHFFRTECAAFDSAVTDWERRRYFERI